MAQDALDILGGFTNDPRMKVFFALLKRLDYENLIVASQAEIARELDMQRTHVNRAIKQLVKIGAILEGPKVGTSRTYRLNPKFGWKGTARNHVIALDSERKARMNKANITGVIDNQERDEKTIDWVEEVEAT
jgi:biotin operon repressor